MRSTAIALPPTTAPAVATGGRVRADDGFANVLARCTDVDASAGPQARPSKDGARTMPKSHDVDATPAAPKAERADDEIDAAADDDVPMLDDADVVAEDESESVAAANDDASPRDVATTEIQVTAAPVHELAKPSAASAPSIRAVVDDPSELASSGGTDTSTRFDAAPTPRSGAIRRPTPADGMDARARASIAKSDAIVTGVPMRTDGGVRVDLRAPVVGPTPVPFGGIAAVANERIDDATPESEPVATASVGPELVASDAGRVPLRDTVVRDPAAHEAVARETAAIETTVHAPRTEARFARAGRTAGERRGPITLARTEATPSPQPSATATSVATPSATDRGTAGSSAMHREDPSTVAERDAVASIAAAVPAEALPPAPPEASAPIDTAVTMTPADSLAMTPSDSLAPPLATPASEPPASRAAPTPTSDAPVVITRAEDLAHAIEKLKPIPRGGATLEVETPGMGQLRLHVRVEDGVVKVRIHASSDAGATWLAQERDGLTAAARGAVNSALGIELDLRGGTNDASDRRPAREQSPTPAPYAGAPQRTASTSVASSSPTPTARARGLVDVLA